jgi:hypothetical protein
MPSQLHLHEVLSGPQSKKFGALPKVAIPGDDETLLRFAKEILTHLHKKEIYRRDNIPVVPYKAKARLEILTAQAFRTEVDEHIACFKQKYDEKGTPYDVIRTINKEAAQGVLEARHFWSGLREIEAVNPVPMAAWTWEGPVNLRKPGYDEASKTLTFG